ncbi:MAG: hypothetical protein WB473_04280 [Pedococcus sp.]
MKQVYVLGEQAVVDDAHDRPLVLSARALALVGCLVLHAGFPQSRQHLAGLIWPDSSAGQALTNLRRELHHLRRTLGDCTVRPYPAGTVFVDPGPALHTAFNQGTQTVTLVGTFFDVAPGEALVTPADAGKQLRLDKKCNIGTVYP